MSQLIITAVGPDRPGIVGELTAHLHSAGGNILDSRMVNLRGEFAMMLLLEAPADTAARLNDELTRVGNELGLRVTVTPQQAMAAPVAGATYRLKTYSTDQPGIVALISGVLRAHGVNIEELTARQESAAFAGSPLFLTEMRLTIPPTVALATLRQELETAGIALNCDVDLDPEAG
ncbi:MAG: ACT domain-containing protein [Tepidisphaeraceae bacterium]